MELLLLIVLSLSAKFSFGFSEWTHEMVLDGEGILRVQWMAMPGGKVIRFKVTGRTLGWMGIGFSPNGGMAGADITLLWVQDHTGTPHALDMYAKGEERPVLDDKQDVTVESGQQNETHTDIVFLKYLQDCSYNGQDFPLGEGTVRLIWSWHPEDPEGKEDSWTPKYHDRSRRGTRSVYLFSPPLENNLSPAEERNFKKWDILSPDVEIPSDRDTLYWCKIFKVPPEIQARPHHMIGYVPVIEADHEVYVHHMLLYECSLPAHSKLTSSGVFEKYVSHAGAPCYAPNMPISWNYCQKEIVAWAVGSEGEYLPERVGIPLADEHRGATYMMMEIHYNNPTLQKGIVDRSGVRVYYTEELRPIEASTLLTGHKVTFMQVLPPGRPRFTSHTICSEHCTRQAIPEDGIKVFQVFLHSHLTGREIHVRHFRNGKELSPIASDAYYDFNYQQAHILPKPVTVLPGDILLTECVYDTTDRHNVTLGGFSTREEMCLAFLKYYPKLEFDHCLSLPVYESYMETLGIQEFYDLEDFRIRDYQSLNLEDETDETGKVESPLAVESSLIRKESNVLKTHLIVKEPEDLRNLSFYEILHQTDWNPKVSEKLQFRLLHGKHIPICRKTGQQLYDYPKEVEYPDVSEISYHKCLKASGTRPNFTLSFTIAFLFLFPLHFLH